MTYSQADDTSANLDDIDVLENVCVQSVDGIQWNEGRRFVELKHLISLYVYTVTIGCICRILKVTSFTGSVACYTSNVIALLVDLLTQFLREKETVKVPLISIQKLHLVSLI